MPETNDVRNSNLPQAADQLGRLVTLGIKWARVLQEDRPNVELKFEYWCRPMSLAAIVDGIPATELILRWGWNTIRTAPDLDLDSPRNELDKVTGNSPATEALSEQTDQSRNPQPPREPYSDLSGPSRQCLEALRHWRAAKARKMGYPAYVIARDTTLIDLAKLRPTKLVDLYSIQSVSYGFSERYGQEVVQLLSDWCTENMEGFTLEPGLDERVVSAEKQSVGSNGVDNALDSDGPELEDGPAITAARCQHCGSLISPERMDVFPDAKYCVKCQEMADNHRGSIPMAPPTCPRCERKGIHSELVYRRARDPEVKGYFLGCSRYPNCQYLEL